MYYPLWWDFSIHCHEKCSLLDKIINIYIMKTNLPCLFFFFFFFFWSNQLEKVWTSQRAALIPSLLKESPSSSLTEYTLCYMEKPWWCVCSFQCMCVFLFAVRLFQSCEPALCTRLFSVWEVHYQTLSLSLTVHGSRGFTKSRLTFARHDSLEMRTIP